MNISKKLPVYLEPDFLANALLQLLVNFVQQELMAAAMAGFLMLGTYAHTGTNPPSSGKTGPSQAPVTPEREDRSLTEMLAPIFTERTDRRPAQRCKPGELYSQHDVVGDPLSCFLNRLDSRDPAARGLSGAF